MAILSPIQRLTDISRLAVRSSLSAASMPIILTALAVSCVLVVALWWLSSWMIGDLLTSTVQWGWLMTLIQSAAGFVIVWALFPLLIPLFISMFLNQLAARIDQQDYAGQPAGMDLPFLTELKLDLRFAARALLLNLLLLPAYLIPGVNLVIYYLLNAYLLGNQYFSMVLRRYVAPEKLKLAMAPFRGTIYTYGLVIVVFASLPGLNLIAPVFATAFMVHLFQLLRPALAGVKDEKSGLYIDNIQHVS